MKIMGIDVGSHFYGGEFWLHAGRDGLGGIGIQLGRIWTIRNSVGGQFGFYSDPRGGPDFRGLKSCGVCAG